MYQKSCLLCHREAECGNLKTLLILMDELDTDELRPEYKGEIEDFKASLEEMDYQYPDGDQSCQLVNCKQTSRDLVAKGTEILSKIQRSLPIAR